MLTKESLIKSLKAMPEEVFEDLDVLFERIVVLDKIENGIADFENGHVVSHEDVKKVIDSWLHK